MKARSWPIAGPKETKVVNSPRSEESCGLIIGTDEQDSSESISSKPVVPLHIFKEQVIEFIQQLRKIDSMGWKISGILDKNPHLHMVKECNDIVEHEFEEEFSRLEAWYYEDLKEDYINAEEAEYMNESDTIGSLD